MEPKWEEETHLEREDAETVSISSGFSAKIKDVRQPEIAERYPKVAMSDASEPELKMSKIGRRRKAPTRAKAKIRLRADMVIGIDQL